MQNSEPYRTLHHTIKSTSKSEEVRKHKQISLVIIWYLWFLK